MKILHAVPTMSGGGAERQLAYLAKQSVQLGHQVTLAYVHPGANLDYLANSPVRLTQLTASSNHDPRILWGLIKLIRFEQPDIVQTWNVQMDILATLASFFTGTPSILSERSSALCYQHGWKVRLRAILGRFVAGVVANSESGRHYWQQFRPRGLSSVIRNGIPFEELQSTVAFSKRELGFLEDQQMILFAGRYSYEKNLPAMIEALKLVLHVRPKTVALLHGEGPLKESLIASLRDFPQASRIHFREYTNRLYSTMKASDLFLSVSAVEGHPNTLLEAVSLGVPVVASNIETHLEFLSPQTANIAPVDSPQKIAESILFSLDNREDAFLKAQRAQDSLKQLSIANMTEQYLEFYRRLLER